MSDATLTIRTGLQGNGKTLNTIKEVDAYGFKTQRPVYFHNITDLKPELLKANWFHFEDPLKWFELPENSIVVVDEAQGWFGNRDPRSPVPPHISHFEIMRKKGHEVHLITQDPRFIDVHARRLCGQHVHYRRVFGSNKVARYQYNGVFADVERISTSKDVDKQYITLDKKFFGVYSSAQADHHFKFKPPRKAVFFAVAIVVVVALVIRAGSMIFGDQSGDASAAAVEPSSTGSLVADMSRSLLGPMGSGQSGASVKTKTVGQYVEERAPRLPNLPSSAPVYDQLTKPVAFPRLYCTSSEDYDVYSRNQGSMPSAIVNGKPTVCQCYSQQATRIDTDFQFCMSVVERGFFDPTIPDRMSQQSRERDSGLGQRRDGDPSVAPVASGLENGRGGVLQAQPAPGVAFLQPERASSPAQNARPVTSL